MPRAELRRLRVTGTGKPPAELEFGPGLTLISGYSNTGKTHILECVDFALGAGTAPREIPEARGYTDVALEIRHGEDVYSVIRRLTTADVALIHDGALADWDGEAGRTVKVDIGGSPDPTQTLSGFLLALGAFDAAMPVVRNQRGETQRLSFRTVAPFALIKEPEVISTNSPVAPPSPGGSTASRSVFRILLTGTAPTPDEVARLRRGHEDRERAKQQVVFLDELIADLRHEIEEANLARRDLAQELARIDEELATVSETVSQSGDRVRSLLDARNAALREAEEARRDYSRAHELRDRFRLLGEHYATDVGRLEFVLEGGHFFQQITAAYCPRCGRPFENADEMCHPETADFAAIERAAGAEIKKLRPRMADLTNAINDNENASTEARARWQRARRKATELDNEIRRVANPSAANARARVRQIGTRRREVEEHLFRFRELDRYTVLRQTAETTAKRKVDRYRPEQTSPSLVSLAQHVKKLLDAWKFPQVTDVYFSLDTDDLVIDGKERNANGKGVRAMTHAAFTIGLMQHCLDTDTPHPGFVVIDTPLTHFKGPTDDVEDPEISRDVHAAFLHSLAIDPDGGQSVIIENVDPPAGLEVDATVHWFSGPEGEGRKGFYTT